MHAKWRATQKTPIAPGRAATTQKHRERKKWTEDTRGSREKSARNADAEAVGGRGTGEGNVPNQMRQLYADTHTHKKLLREIDGKDGARRQVGRCQHLIY